MSATPPSGERARRELRPAAWLLGLLALAPAAASAGDEEVDRPAKACRPALAVSIATGFAVSEQRVLDVDRDGKADLLVVGTHGEVRVWRWDAAAKRIGEKPVGALLLRFPDRTLLAVADLLHDGSPPQLVEMTKDGVFVHRVEKDGSYTRGGEALAPRAKFPLRVGRPLFVDIARDVNGDGRADLVVPRGEDCELWLNGGSAKAPTTGATELPAFTKAATIRVDLQHETMTRSEALSDILEESFRVPNLQIADVNADGRADLRVENGKSRSWHMQREDGSFPAEPDVVLDLDTFRDTTPEASVQLGRTLAGGDDQRLETRDLDGDGIPDYVIAHRRKVWVFHGTKAGPQFTDFSQVLRVADDVTMLLLVRLDDDPRPDLLLLRLQVPTIATILRGLVSEWDVEITAAGYENTGNRKFDVTPKWRGGAEVHLPALLGVLRDPEPLVRRFEDAARSFRRAVPGDFDGDGRPDIALLAQDGSRVDLFTARASGAGSEPERAIGDIFFAEDRKAWDLDAILRWLGDSAERQAAGRTGGKPPFASWPLRNGDGLVQRLVAAGDFDGDGRTELVIAYEGNGEGLIDVVRVE